MEIITDKPVLKIGTTIDSSSLTFAFLNREVDYRLGGSADCNWFVNNPMCPNGQLVFCWTLSNTILCRSVESRIPLTLNNQVLEPPIEIIASDRLSWGKMKMSLEYSQNPYEKLQTEKSKSVELPQESSSMIPLILVIAAGLIIGAGIIALISL